MARSNAFEFVHAGRTYSCYVEKLGDDAWWWFTNSGEGHRYAPFQATSKDTQASVKDRMIAYHTNFLERRAAPPVPRHQGGGPGRPPGNSMSRPTPPPPPPATMGKISAAPIRPVTAPVRAAGGPAAAESARNRAAAPRAATAKKTTAKKTASKSSKK